MIGVEVLLMVAVVGFKGSAQPRHVTAQQKTLSCHYMFQHLWLVGGEPLASIMIGIEMIDVYQRRPRCQVISMSVDEAGTPRNSGKLNWPPTRGVQALPVYLQSATFYSHVYILRWCCWYSGHGTSRSRKLHAGYSNRSTSEKNTSRASSQG